MMTVDSAHYTEFFQQGQDVVRKSVDAWTRNATLVADQLPAFSKQLDAESAIDRYFDLGEKVLEAQRDFAKSLMGAATSVGVGSARRPDARSRAGADGCERLQRPDHSLAGRAGPRVSRCPASGVPSVRSVPTFHP